MDISQFWASIPHGKNDPPFLLFDPTNPCLFDFHDPDSQYVMFNRELEGCFVLPFTKPMAAQPGNASVDGKAIRCIVKPVKLMGFDTWWLGLKLGGYLNEYGKTITVQVSGFRDMDGNEMIPATVTVQTEQITEPTGTYAEHEQIALRAAQDGIVLLKNENQTLPLPKNTMLNLFGKGLFEFRLCAVGAGKIYPRYAVGLLEAARNDPAVRVNEELTAFYACGEDRIPGTNILERTKEHSDTAIMVISRCSGENTDNSTNPGEFYLTEDEELLLKALREHFEKLVVILNVGYPIGIGFAETYQVDAVVYCGLGGMFAGSALMDVLTGRVNPSAKLPFTWSARYDSIPAARNFYDCAGGKERIITDNGAVWLNTVYEEDIYVGYRYFETFPNADRGGYPFGHGMSYTTFERKCTSCTYHNGELKVAVAVTNTGNMPGKEVVQLYLSKPQGTLEQPAKELIGFEKTVLLAPGETKQLSITVPESRMVSYDEPQAAYLMVPGEYTVHLGGSVRETVQIGRFALAEEKIVKRVKKRMGLNMPLARMTRDGNMPEGKDSGILPEATGLSPKRAPLEQFRHKELPMSERELTFRDVLADESLLAEFVGNMDVKTLARIAVCACDGWGVEGRGEAGRLYRPEGLELPEFVVADGNSGVNLRTRNIGMPSGATLCASFDKSLMEQVGAAIGEEAKELGIHLILAPGMNLQRNPLNGRHPEYFSEDPYLAGAMAGNYCKGLESTGVGGCYKHLIANNAESGRKRNQSVISERAIRELYFRAFQYALEEHEPLSVMTAYNAVNGVFTSCDPELIQGLLYEECGFEGFVMTDWTSYDSADVAEMVAAGNAWITPGSSDETFTGQIEAAVADGRIPLAQLQNNVLRIIRVLVKLNK